MGNNLLDSVERPCQTGLDYVTEAFMLAFPLASPEEQRFVFSFTAYLDESGTHHGSDSLTIAGFVSTAARWIEFSDKWQLALNDFDLDYFHMTDFANRVGAYASWPEADRRLRLARLLGIISQTTLFSISTSIPLAAFERTFSARAKEICGGAYGLAATNCFMALGQLMRDQALDGWVNYVFETGVHGRGQVATIFNVNERNPDQKTALRLLSLRFEDKRRFLPLQAADILAYELYKNWSREEAVREHREEDKRTPRFPLGYLAAQSHNWGYPDEAELQKWNGILSMRAAWEDQGILGPSILSLRDAALAAAGASV